MRVFVVIGYMLIIILGLSFAALNAASVSVNFFFKQITLPISILMILMLGLGMLIGILLFAFRYYRLKVECRRMKDELKISSSTQLGKH
jgi:putative membrane protein